MGYYFKMEVFKIGKRISIIIIGFLLAICIFNNNIFAANKDFNILYELNESTNFDGSSISIDTGVSQSVLLDDYSIAIDFTVNDWYSSDHPGLFGLHSDLAGLIGFQRNGSSIVYGFNRGGELCFNVKDFPVAQNLKLVVSYNKTTNIHYVYLNGVLIGSGSIGVPNILDDNIIIGRSFNSVDRFFNGTIRTFKIYDKFFNSSEIEYLFNNSFVFSFPSITVTTSSYPSRVQIIETQALKGMDLDLYEICYSFNDGNWKSMFHSSDDSWFTSATRNGVYKFRYCYKGTTNQVEGTTTSSLTINNIITSGSEFSDDVLAPILTIEYNGLKDGSRKSVSIRTQYMTYDEISHLDFYWSDGTNLHPEDITLWYTNNFYSTEINGITYYYFQQSIYENVTFSCSFYDGLKGQFSQISVAEIDIDKYYEEYKESKEDPPTLLEHILKALNSLNPFSSEFLGYKLVGLFGDLLKSLFVPSDNFFTSNIDDLKSQISNKMPYSDFLKIFGSIENVSAEDNSISINLPEYKISDNLTIKQDKFIDFSFVTKYREVWYSWVRGFVLIFLVIYNLNQISKLLRGVNISDAATSIGMHQPSNGQISGQISLFGGKKR